jgi:hypothetical protein
MTLKNNDDELFSIELKKGLARIRKSGRSIVMASVRGHQPDEEMIMVAISTAAAKSATKKIGGIKAITKGRSDTFHIDPMIIQIDPTFNARDFTTPENIAHVVFLEGSIENNGVKEPMKITMRGDVPFVTNGESRLRAIRNCL